MSKSVNKKILLGNVGKDPEIKSMTGGTLVDGLGGMGHLSRVVLG